jgi:hypothetical protein
VINLGTNDSAYGISSSTFQSSYVSFLRNIRSKYPLAYIFVMRPFNGARTTQCQAAVNTLRSSGDARVFYINTFGWLASTDFVDGLHPTDQGHVKIMQRLAPILRPYMPTQSPTNTPVPTTSGPTLKLQYRTLDTLTTDNKIRPGIRIMNLTSSAVPWSQLKIRYYFTRDTNQTPVFTCDYAAFGCANVTGRFVTLSATGTDYYLEVGFTSGAGSIAANSTTLGISPRIHKADWSNFDESNDYSFDVSKTAYMDWTKVTLYHNGVLIWGTEPSSMSAAAAPTFQVAPTATP